MKTVGNSGLRNILDNNGTTMEVRPKGRFLSKIGPNASVKEFLIVDMDRLSLD
jgi:hypothetical protein